MRTMQRWTGADACRLQAALRMSHEAFAAKIGVATRTVAGWHERPQTVPRPEMQQALDVLLERAPAGVLSRFHGPATEPDRRGTTLIRSHKFITAYPGVADAAGLAGSPKAQRQDDLLGGHVAVSVPHPSGSCTLHAWEHGVVIAHLVQEPDCESLAGFSQWRYRSYGDDLAWIGTTVGAPGQYVISAYWVELDGWGPRSADRAVRVVCMPRVLCGDGTTASLEAEKQILATGFDHPDLVSFGVADSSIGYASWSGVAYAPLDPARSLPESCLVDIELPLQAVWTYCWWIREQVEQGRDPAIPEGFGWRWLRGALSRLTAPRPQESNPHRSMRDAIVATSGLPGMVQDAIAALREVER